LSNKKIKGERSLSRFLFDNKEYKDIYINVIDRLNNDLVLQDGNEKTLCFEFEDINELKDAKIINWDDDPKIEEWQTVIQEEESTAIQCRLFKSEFGYYSNSEDGAIDVPNSEIINFFELEENSKLIDNLELFHPKFYLQRVAVNGSEIAMFERFFLDLQLNDNDINIRLNTQDSFLFSYKLLKNKHPEPLSYDSFIEISGNELDLEECRTICKTLIFEINCVSGLVLTPSPNIPPVIDEEAFEKHVEAKKEQLKDFASMTKSFLVCKDTVKVIELYNRAISCEDSEMSILYFSKVIEYVSETVVRMKITEEGRKALSSSRSSLPDANFIKELQELFKSHSYSKDAESMELTIQTCCYINDIIKIIPEYIIRQFEKNRNQSDQAALQYLAKCISATRNSIAHAKANYRATGFEVPESNYEGFAQLMRVICQQCIRWYSAQGTSMRIVS
jgi:hypothetical protein